MSESDGVDEVVGGGLRVALTAAGLAAEHLARVRAERARQATAESTEAARAMTARLSAERATARAQLAVVDRDEWWRSASVRDVADVWETAQAWRQVDPEADRAAGRIARQIRDRYDVDVEDGTPVDRDALERAVTARQHAAAERRRAQGAGEALEASLVLAADEANRVAEVVDEAAQAKLAAEVGETERPIDLAHMVVARLRRSAAETDVVVARAEQEQATGSAAAYESAEARLLAQAGPSAGRGPSSAPVDEATRRVQSSTAAAYPARAVADKLNAKPVTAAASAGKAALRAPRPRKTVDRSAERSRGR